MLLVYILFLRFFKNIDFFCRLWSVSWQEFDLPRVKTPNLNVGILKLLNALKNLHRYERI